MNSMSGTILPGGQGHGEAVEQRFGLYPAIVEEIDDPDGKARIKLELPWIRRGFVTEWVPVAQIYAGGGYGAYWIPEVGDQVIIAFLRGELRKPIVVGSIYSEQKKPHIARESGVDPKVLRTKTGHMLLMEEGNEPLIRLIDSSGNNEIEINTNEKIITIRSEDHVIVEAGGNVQVKAGGSVSVEASQDISLSAGGSISIEASGQLTISGATVAIN